MPLLIRDEVVDLCERVQAGDQAAIDKIVERNMGMIISQAQRHAKRYFGDHDDFIQQAAIGVIEAAKRFNPSKGTAFSTYAAVWIKQCCQRWHRETGHLVRVPSYAHGSANLAGQRDGKFTLPNGKEPGPVWENCIRSALGFRAVGGDSFLHLEFIAAPEVDPPDYGDDECARLTRAIQLMSRKEPQLYFVLARRFGLDDHDPHTLRECGLLIGLSRERIRQIETHALVWLCQRINPNRDPETIVSPKMYSGGHKLRFNRG